MLLPFAEDPLEVLPESLRWQQRSLEIHVQGLRSEEFEKQLTNNLVISQGNQVLPNQPSVNLEIVKRNQQQIDSGSSPWQLDPMQVAFTFAALQISPSGINCTPSIDYGSLKVTTNTGTDAVIQISEGPVKTVYLKRLVEIVDRS